MLDFDLMAAIKHPQLAPQQKKLFYGWVIVGASMAATMVIGEAMFCFSLFLKPLESEFLLNRATISSAYSMFILGYAVSCIVTGRISERYSPRIILLASAVLCGLGMLLSASARDINQFRAFMLLTGLGSGALWTLPASMVMQWFKGRPRAGLALGIVTAGSSLSMFIFPPVITALILAHGWRYSYVIMGIFVLVITTTGTMLMKSPPEAHRPDKATAKTRQTEMPTAKLVFRPAYLGIAFANIVGMLVFQAISSHLAAYATDTGISDTAAAFALSIVGAVSIPSRLVSGLIADRIGWRRVLVAALLCISASMAVLLLIKGTSALYLFVLLYGMAHGSRTPAQVGIIGEFYSERLRTLVGLTLATGQFIGLLAPYFTGYIHDQTGSYAIAFVILAAAVLVGALVTMSLKKEPASVPGLLEEG